MQNRAADAIAPLERAARRSGDPSIETLLATALGAAGRGDPQRDAVEEARHRAAIADRVGLTGLGESVLAILA